MSRSDSRIYIGNLPDDVRSKDIEDIFYKFGRIRYVDLKNRKGPPFAFVEFEDARDAKDAVESRDGYNFDGHRLRVEFQKGPRGGGVGRGGGGRSGPPTRRSDYRCIITGLPTSGSWQDLKDHMREAGNVCYADVFRDGTGVVEFIRYEDMKYAIKHLDDTKFRSHEGDSSYIRVKADTTKNRSRSNSRSRSRSRSISSGRRRSKRGDDRERASPSYSPVKRSPDSSDSEYDERRTKNGYHSKRSRRSRTRSRSRSRSRSSRSKSHSRSRSRSSSAEREKRRRGDDAEAKSTNDDSVDALIKEAEEVVSTGNEDTKPGIGGAEAKSGENGLNDERNDDAEETNENGLDDELRNNKEANDSLSDHENQINGD